MEIWGNKEPRREGQYRGSRSKNAVFSGGGGEGLLTYKYISTEIKYMIQRYILSDDDMIYTHANMYIAFVTPVIDVRDRDLV